MAKPIQAIVKLQISAGKANPSPPVGPALGQHGVNIMDFCKAFNEKTAKMGDTVLPVVITIYKDRTFSFVVKTPLTSILIKKALGIEKGSGDTPRTKVGKLTREQLEEIAKQKMPDLNANDIEAAMKIVAGTAKNMGVDVEL